MSTTIPRLDVIGLGAVAVDELLYVESYPPADSKSQVQRRERQCGGLTGTALVAAARLGARVSYAGVLGNDELSQFVGQRLTGENVDLSHCVFRDEARPAHSTIIVDTSRHTRTIFCSLGGEIGPADDAPPREVIAAAQVLLIDHHGLEGTLRAARIARESGVHVVADFERDPGPPFTQILALVDHLVISESFGRQLTGQPDASAVAAALWNDDRQAVVITCGRRGCWYMGRDDRVCRHQPAFPVEVIDTTGCGDVFHGAYAAALAWGDSLPKRVVLASATAAIKATRRGGQTGIPHLAEVKRLIAAQEAGADETAFTAESPPQQPS